MYPTHHIKSIHSKNMTTTFYPKRKFSRSCAFCHEAGHHVRDCTTLANTECKYCHNLGHTTRRCPVLAERDMNRRRRANAQRYKPDSDGFSQAKNTFRRRVSRAEPVMSSSTRLTTFTALAVEADTEPKKKSVQIAVPAPAKQLPVQGSWKKPLNTDIEREPPRKVAAVAAAEPKKKSYIGMWADAADMADEEDEESDDDIELPTVEEADDVEADEFPLDEEGCRICLADEPERYKYWFIHGVEKWRAEEEDEEEPSIFLC